MSYKSSYTGAQIDSALALANTAVQPARTVNGHALSADVTVTATDVGLGNVTNESKATMFGTPTFTGDATLSTGNLVIGTSGKGIDFSGTDNASGMTSELLNDYEEGTWTVTWYNLAAGTPANTTGYYTKIGRLVFFTYAIGANSIQCTGGTTSFSLPFVPAISAAGTMIRATVVSGADVTLIDASGGGQVYPQSFYLSYMYFSGVYHT